MSRPPLSAGSHVVFGAALPPAPATGPEERFTLSDLGRALGKITPSLLVLGIATGAAFAIGSGLASRYILKGK